MELRLEDPTAPERSAVSGETRAFVLLETARLRCELLMKAYGRTAQLRAIHREVGTAGYVTCEAFDPTLRNSCVALAVQRVTEDRSGRERRSFGEAPLDLGRILAIMFSETIAASDALASELADREVDEDHRDRLHLVHAHVMSACELLDERLTVLELEGAGLDV